MVVAINILTGVMIFVSFLLIMIVLLQEDKSGGGIGMIGGSSQSFFGASSGSLLTKITTVLVVIFFVLSVVIGSLSAESTKRSTISEYELLVDKYGKEDTTTDTAKIVKAIQNAPTTILVSDINNLVLAKIQDEAIKTEFLTYYELNKNGIHYNLTKLGTEKATRVVELLNSVQFSLEAQPTIITQ